MTTPRTRLADMMADLNIWLDRLSHWQFVAAVASTAVASTAVASTAVASINVLAYVVADASSGSPIFAWRRWR